MYYILYNPKSSNSNVLKKINKLYKKLSKKHTCYKINLFDINLKEKVFFNQCNSDDTIIICGGDGSLDQFINRIYGEPIKCKIFFYPCGSGNDFARDFNGKGKLIEITNEVYNCPKLLINGEEKYVFVNGVGMGVDAAVCRSKAQYKFSNVKKGYFSISLETLKTFRTYSVDLEIDGEKRHYDNVWFFIVNHGKFMGGGMRVTPKAKRDDEYLDVCIVHTVSHKKIIAIFPFIFLGKHVWFKKYVDIIRCKTFKAVPNGCNILQRDGEVLDYVRSIEVER